MAEGTSTRSDGQRTTPRAAPASSRSVRMTRSQSREISDGEGIPMGPNARKRNAKDRTNGNNILNHSLPTRRQGKMTIPSETLQDLSVVPEDPSVMPPNLRETGGAGEEDHAPEVGSPHQDVPHQSMSPRRVSAFSGTTARTSRSAQDLSNMSSEDMIDALEELVPCSDKLLKFLMPSELSRDSITTHMNQLQTKGSRAKRKLEHLRELFAVSRVRCGSGSYIAHQEILTILFDKLPLVNNTGPWQPDALLEKANLAVLATGILCRPSQEWDIHSMEELEKIFPKPFCSGFGSPENTHAGQSILKEKTFDIALDIRTQDAIMLFVHHHSQLNFDSDVILHNLFYKRDDSLRGWDVIGIHSDALTKEQEGAILSRLQDLRDVLANSDDSATGIRLLQQAYPWMDFVQHVIDWTSQRLEELDTQIQANGGFGGILEALNEEIQKIRLGESPIKNERISRDGSPSIELVYDPPSEAPIEVPRPRGKGKTAKVKLLKLGQFNANSPKAREAATTLKQIEARRKSASTAKEYPPQQNQLPVLDFQVSATALQEEETSIDPSHNPAVPIEAAPEPQPDDSWRPQEDDDEVAPLVPDSPEFGLQLRARHQKRHTESIKENIDHSVSQREQSSGNGQKRSLLDRQPNAQRIEFDDDEIGTDHQSIQTASVTSDEIFERINSPAKASSRRPLQPVCGRPGLQTSGSQSKRPPAKRARLQEAGRSHRARTSVDVEDDEPPRSQALTDYRRANTAGKENKVLKNRSKLPQTRTPWSEEETDRLLDLIIEHGTSWSVLMGEDESADGLLQSRGQVGIRDKARNMKVDFLRGGRYLPKHFDQIVINKIHIEKLKELGIKYDPETGRRNDALASESDSE